ncbi:hypothetical protein C7S18_04420 [Ahniella affigens]|uniref:Glycerate kinase n=1 Tax=Ahniella affigens TaxID=2021234 RepID=A0A2P1PNT7_9GAMM|nr:hypothetical protein C7S18_04420 [Ahniella affigens]
MIVIAPGTFKGTLRSLTAANIIGRALRTHLPRSSVSKVVIADGGEGTLEMLRSYFNVRLDAVWVSGPTRARVRARRAWFSRSAAFLESSQAIGLSLAPPGNLNPMSATSRGLGELIFHTIKDGARTVQISMGDSAVMDVGVGMLAALGVVFYSRSGPIENPSLRDLARVVDFNVAKYATLLGGVSVECLVDTDDFLCGAFGQASMYGAQKGLRPEDRNFVEDSILHFCELIKAQIGIDIRGLKRASGSGGVAGALHAFSSAALHNTLEYFSSRHNVGWDAMLSSADVVITGEGRLDEQTRFGKVPHFVARRVKGRCVVIAGSTTSAGIKDLESVCSRVSVVELGPAGLRDARFAISSAVPRILRLLGEAS